MMVHEMEPAAEARSEPGLEQLWNMQLELRPQQRRLLEGRKPFGRIAKIGFEQPLELHEGPFVKRDVVDVRDIDSPLVQAIHDGSFRIARIAFFPGKPFFLRGRHNDAVAYEGGR